MKSPAEALDRPPQPGRVASILLALAVHAAFFSLIVFGVSWQSRPTPPMQAELWDKLPPGKPAAAPKPDPAPPAAEPKPEPPPPEPKAEPRPEPPKVEPRPEPPRPDPAIAERKEKEKKAREKKEQERKDLERKEQEKKKEQERKKEQEKKEQDRKEREAKAAADAKAAAEAKAKATAKAAADAKAKAETEAQAKAAEAAAQARLSEIDRFRSRIRDKIRGKANVPETVTGRPEVQVRITILPGGEVLDIVIVKASGNRAYDAAIERAIRSAQPLPVPSEPELFGQFRSLTLNIQHER